MARQPSPCGTAGGYSGHKYRRETPCDACRDAAALYQREYSRDHRRSRATQRARQSRIAFDLTDALCAQVGGDLWFVEKGESTRPAKRVCELCTVRQACLDYSLQFDLDGTWGGLSRPQRRKLQHDQGIDPQPHIINGDAA